MRVAVAAICMTIAASVGPSAAMAAALYVSPTGSDTASGNAGAPLRTILAASRRATPGTTVHVAPGAYEGGFMTTASGAPGEPIRYVSDVRGGARIVPAEKSTHDIAWENRGAYVTIDGFEVDGSEIRAGVRWRLGLYTAGSHSVIEDSNVHHVANTVPCTSQGGAGIEGDSYYGGADIVLSQNVVHDIGPRSCKFIHGLYQTASGRVVNNIVYHVSGWGIHLWHDVHSVAVANNTVFNCLQGGILVGGGDYVRTTGPADHITVANNIVFDNAGFGIAETGETGLHNLYTHNLSDGNGRDWRLLTSSPDRFAVEANPDFVHYLPDGGGNYHLAQGSPAIGAGLEAVAPPVDLDGVPRRQSSNCDMGAYGTGALH